MNTSKSVVIEGVETKETVSSTVSVNPNNKFFDKELFVVKRVSKGYFDFNLLNHLNYAQKTAIAYKMLAEIGLPLMILNNDEVSMVQTEKFDPEVFERVIHKQIKLTEKREDMNTLKETIVSEMTEEVVTVSE